jgi:hypothetical protein
VLPLINGEIESRQQGRGSDLHRIREYTQEDSARHVDWKATAKSGSLKVREFAREDQRKLRIIFDNPESGVVSDDKYERAIALTASLGWHFAMQNAEVSFTARRYKGSDIHQFLAELAVLEPGEPVASLEDLQHSDGYNIVVTSRARGAISTALWSTSYFVFIGEPARQSGHWRGEASRGPSIQPARGVTD